MPLIPIIGEMLLQMLIATGITAGGKAAFKAVLKKPLTAVAAKAAESAVGRKLGGAAATAGAASLGKWGDRVVTLGDAARKTGNFAGSMAGSTLPFVGAMALTAPLFESAPGEWSTGDIGAAGMQPSAFGQSQLDQLAMMDERGLETNAILELLGDTNIDRLREQGLI